MTDPRPDELRSLRRQLRALWLALLAAALWEARPALERAVAPPDPFHPVAGTSVTLTSWSDPAGGPTAILHGGSKETGPELRLDAGHGGVVHLGTALPHPDGPHVPAIVLRDDEGRRRLSLHLDPRGDARLVAYGEAEEPVARWP